MACCLMLYQTTKIGYMDTYNVMSSAWIQIIHIKTKAKICASFSLSRIIVHGMIWFQGMPMAKAHQHERNPQFHDFNSFCQHFSGYLKKIE